MSNLSEYLTQNVCEYLEQSNQELIQLRKEVKELVKLHHITGNRDITDNYDICDTCDTLLRKESNSWMVCVCGNCNNVVCNQCEYQGHKIYKDKSDSKFFLCNECTNNHIEIPNSWQLMK